MQLEKNPASRLGHFFIVYIELRSGDCTMPDQMNDQIEQRAFDKTNDHFPEMQNSDLWFCISSGNFVNQN